MVLAPGFDFTKYIYGLVLVIMIVSQTGYLDLDKQYFWLSDAGNS